MMSIQGLIECIVEEFNRHFEFLAPLLSEHDLADYTSILDANCNY